MKFTKTEKDVTIPEGGACLVLGAVCRGPRPLAPCRARLSPFSRDPHPALPVLLPAHPPPPPSALLGLAVKVEVKARTVKVTGPKGTLERAFKSNSFSAVMTSPTNLHVEIWYGSRKQIACLGTICTHVENMIKGVTKGYVYKMRFAYAHFPINVSTTPKEVQVRNFLGERRVRKVTMLDGVTVKRSDGVKDEITIEGNDLEKVSGSAAQVHECCLVKNKDIRKFLDGLYVSEKGVNGAMKSLM
jgi:large subunit ribosomal protein L9e